VSFGLYLINACGGFIIVNTREALLFISIILSSWPSAVQNLFIHFKKARRYTIGGKNQAVDWDRGLKKLFPYEIIQFSTFKRFTLNR